MEIQMLSCRSLSFKKTFVCIALLLSSSLSYADTYDVSSFQLAGITLGVSEKEVIRIIADNFSVSTDKIKLTREKERPHAGGAVNPRVSRTYEHDGNKISVNLIPNYLTGNGTERVVGQITYSLDEPNAELRAQLAAEFKDKITQEKGGPSKASSGNFPIYYWCSVLNKIENASHACDMKEPFLQVDFNYSCLEDRRYSRAWLSAARK